MLRLIAAVRNHSPAARFGAQMAVDAFAWFAAIAAAVTLRAEFDVTSVPWRAVVVFGLLAATLQLITGAALHLYRGRYPYGGFHEVRSLLISALATTALTTLGGWFAAHLVDFPRSAPLIAGPIALVGMAGARYLKRLLVESGQRANSDGAQPTLVYGAGYLGSIVIDRMKRDRAARYRPVGVIDDSPSRRNAWLMGVPVLGTGADLAAIATKTGATVVVVAISAADAAFLSRISDAVEGTGLRVKVLPPLTDVIEGGTRLRDLRDLAIEDVIGRHPVDLRTEEVAGYLTGKRVLVTGAGGSIGSELCRQIDAFNPAELILLDRDETSLQETQISLRGHGLLDSDELVLADIRDAEGIASVFASRRPDVVFHAAALKHLPLLERHPAEGWKTNVIGTLNVLAAARAAGVETFVNVSTDKAADPTSTLGRSKRIAERLTAWYSSQTGNRYLSVRFGNVIGSRGSMLPTFTALIEAGGPITVTDPEVTRYFMTIPEACQLVIQAGAFGQAGEILVLDMGEPVRIVDVARRMIEFSGRDIEIVFTGLRVGEKLHERLLAEGESAESKEHPAITHVKAFPLSPDELDGEIHAFAQARSPRDE